MATSPNVCFESQHFSAGVEAGAFRPGREFANWVAAELQTQGEMPGQPIAEDWGWLVPLQTKPYRLFVGCGLRDGSTTEWVAFAAAERGLLSRLLHRTGFSARLAELTEKLRAAGSSSPFVTRTWLETDDA